MKTQWHVVAGILTNRSLERINTSASPSADAVDAADVVDVVDAADAVDAVDAVNAVNAVDEDLKVLIARRPAGKPHAGLWEFPGGKREVGEAALQALRRELQEEVAVTIKSASPLVSRYYDYDDYSIFLQSWLVHDYLGIPEPLEGQVLKWVTVSDLVHYQMPEANAFVVEALMDCSYLSLA